MKITFWGAARTVTGSMHELALLGHRYLLDCGQFQGRRQEARERNSQFPFPPGAISAVVLSHAHIDHSGNLPVLVKLGFSGLIHASAATADLCVPMLADSAHLQEMDAKFLNKRNQRRRLVDESAPDNAIEPVFTAEDAERTFPLFRPAPMRTAVEVGPGISYTAFDAGHMLGSTCVVIDAAEDGKRLRLAYSGDVGRRGLPIIRDPEAMPPVDYLIMESTYGDRLHLQLESVKSKLGDIVNRTARRGGKIIVPAFAVGRTQQIVVLLHELIVDHAIPSLPIFVDSPLAVNVTEVFRRHAELFDSETRVFLENGDDPFGFSRLRYVRDVAESKALNDLRGPCVIISASGMCEAGRILHHLRNNIEDPRNTILITGFQAENTLGRKILEKHAEVPVFGEPMRLRAEVAKVNELSGHADQRELLQWMKPMVSTLRRVFLVHGETRQQTALATAIRDQYGLDVTIPERGQSFVLS
jgi:metallo-beta-lactamase family protein